MISPFDPSDLFEINPNHKIQFNDGVLIVDDWYSNYEEIYNLLHNCFVPKWKGNDNSKNFIDYYDCRSCFLNQFANHKFYYNVGTIVNMVQNYFEESSQLNIFNKNYEFNYYKNIKKNISSDFQHMPHIDNDYNVIVYFDKVCSGGTAIYDINYIDKNEEDDIFYNVSGIRKRVIQSKPNRMVVFNGNQWHGGYIEDHNQYVNDWRINQVSFLEKV